MDLVSLGELAALGTAVTWTLSTMAWTSAGQRIGALPVSFIRLILATAILLVYCRVWRGWWIPTYLAPADWQMLAISGCLGFFLCDICLFKSFLLIGLRLGLLVNSLTPPLAAIISRFFLGDTLTWYQWLAMVITLTGVTWVVLERRDNGVNPHDWRQTALGVGLSAFGAVAQAVGMVLSKKAIGNYDAMDATFIRILGALPAYLLLTTVLGNWPALARGFRHSKAMSIMIGGVLLGPLLGVALHMIALRHCPTGVAATITATMPVMVLPLVIVVYRERVSFRATLGALVSLAGVALLVVRPAQHPGEKPHVSLCRPEAYSVLSCATSPTLPMVGHGSSAGGAGSPR